MPSSEEPKEAVNLASFPPELKREILETTAIENPKTALRYALLSKDVRPWIERIIYSEVYFRELHYYTPPRGPPQSGESEFKSLTQLAKFLWTTEQRGPSFFADVVKTVHFASRFDEQQMLRVLEVCNGITNLGLYAAFSHGDAPQLSDKTAALFAYVHTLPLQRLFCTDDTFQRLLSSAPPVSGLFKLTHLAITDTSPTKEQLARFKRLTHLAVMFRSEDADFERLNVALAYMSANPRMRAVVIMLNTYASVKVQTKAKLKMLSVNDPRIVIFTMPLSQKIYFEDDIWNLATEFPDEDDPPVRYLTEIPEPRILSFEELQEWERQHPQAVQAQTVQAAA